MKVLAAGTNQRKSENGTTAQHLKAFELGLIPKQDGPQLWSGLTGMDEKRIASGSASQAGIPPTLQEYEQSQPPAANVGKNRSYNKKLGQS